ncbi:MAG: hypothetical protein AUF67_07415 [Acidobacteria bacterium 13_1_20CM_58_21]|nr:MAG: hypothetical protein AUF67_07415 [Acidobacteria bacterium 13_1_20CM_58_21]
MSSCRPDHFARELTGRWKRKEVKIMSYVKPEVAVLGDATSVILGHKQQAQEPGQPSFIKNLLVSTDSELDS